MELSYQIDEDDALRHACTVSGLSYSEIETAYCEVGGFQGYAVTVDLSDDKNNPFVKAIQDFLEGKGIHSVNIVQDH